ncbi:MAG: efflux RND transporter periplasmic adaptor subunit [Pseudomonadota bacterium]
MLSNPWIKRVAGALVVLLVVFFGWRMLAGRGGPAVSFETGVIDKGTVEKSISSTGSVAALVTVDVGSQISGQIAELHADFNTTVKKNDLLAVIDPQTYKSRVTSAEADLAVAQANIGSQQASLRKAQTSLDQSRRDFERVKSLVDRQLVSVSDVETARKNVELAESDVLIAQAQLRNATAAQQTRKATLDQARIDLSRTQIRSPIDGVVIQRAIDLGQTVAASLQAPLLFKIAQDLSRIQIEAKVDEADIGSIKDGDNATFTVDAFPDQTFQGRVAQVRLASTTVQNVVTYSVMVQANNPREMLIPGMTANVRIVTNRRDNVMRAPNDAARFQPAGAIRTAGAPGAAGGLPGGGDFGGGAGGAGGQGQGNRGGLGQDMVKELGLSKEQEAKLDKARQELFAQVRQQSGQQQGGGITGAAGGGFPGGGGFQGGGGNFNNQNQQGQAMRNRIENMMAGVLTPEQLEKYKALRSARGTAANTSRPGTLWTLEGGKPVAHEVRLGVADDRYTEVVKADLKEGDKVIIRARTEVRK